MLRNCVEFLVVVCHPNPKSFNRALADRAVRTIREGGASAELIDLYREPFEPVLPEEEMLRRFSFDETVQRYARSLASADGYLIVHPDWWGMPPALLKGWLDRVFRPGVAYDFEGPEFVRKRKVTLLHNKRALVFVTSDVPAASDDAELRTRGLEGLWVDAVFGYCGVSDTAVRVFCGVHDSSLRERRGWLDEVEETVARWMSNRDASY